MFEQLRVDQTASGSLEDIRGLHDSLTQEEIRVFDMYFAGIVSIRCHPVNGAVSKVNLKECADVALRMILVRRYL